MFVLLTISPSVLSLRPAVHTHLQRAKGNENREGTIACARLSCNVSYLTSIHLEHICHLSTALRPAHSLAAVLPRMQTDASSSFEGVGVSVGRERQGWGREDVNGNQETVSNELVLLACSLAA